MPIKVTCQKCGNVLHAPDTAAGKKGKCPKCATVMDIPGAKPPAGPVAATPPPAPAPVAAEAGGNPFDFFGGGPAPAPAPAPAPKPASKAVEPPAKLVAKAPPPPPSKPVAPPPSKPASAAKPPAKPAPPPSDNPFDFFGGAPAEPAPAPPPAPPKAASKAIEKPAARTAPVSKPTPPPAPSAVPDDNPFSFDGDLPSPAVKPASKPEKAAPPSKPAPVAVAKAVVVPAEKPAEKPLATARPAKLTAPAKPVPGPASDNPFAFLDTVVTDPALQPSGDAVRLGEAPTSGRIPDGSGAFDVKIEDDPPGTGRSAVQGMVSGLYDVRIEDDEDDGPATKVARVVPVTPAAPPPAPVPPTPAPSGNPFAFDSGIASSPQVAIAPPAPPSSRRAGDSSVDAEVVEDEDDGPGKAIRVRAGSNTETPALLALRVKGYRLWMERVRIDDPQSKFYPIRVEFHAEANGSRFTADSATELLGLVALWETRGDNWTVRPGEPNVLEELRKAAAKAGK